MTGKAGSVPDPATIPTRPYQPCMSRHIGNVGKPRPPVEWLVTYACDEGHSPGPQAQCDRCASALVDGWPRCEKCLGLMKVSALERLATAENGPLASVTETPAPAGSGSSAWPADYVSDYSQADYDLDNGPQS